MKSQFTLWPRLARGAAKAIHDRATQSLLTRDSVIEDEKGEIFVNYLPSINGGTPAQLRRAEVGPVSSGADQFYKFVSLITLVVVPVASTLRVVFPLLPIDEHAIYASVFDRSALAITCFAGGLLPLNTIPLMVHLNTIDVKWQNGISHLFDPDARTRMKSVQDVLSAFRSFVKWRRYMSYLIMPAWLMLIAQILLYPLQARTIWNSGTEILTTGRWDIAILAIEFLSIASFSYLRWYFTDLRDPTLHLNVMIAEDFRAVEAARNKR